MIASRQQEVRAVGAMAFLSLSSRGLLQLAKGRKPKSAIALCTGSGFFVLVFLCKFRNQPAQMTEGPSTHNPFEVINR